MAALAPAARAEIMAIFPELQSADFSKTPPAGPFLDGEQGVMLAKAHKSANVRCWRTLAKIKQNNLV
jgi:hypothetical protein